MTFARLFMQIALIAALLKSQHAYGQTEYTATFKGETYKFIFHEINDNSFRFYLSSTRGDKDFGILTNSFKTIAENNKLFNMIYLDNHGPREEAYLVLEELKGERLKSSHLLFQFSCADPTSDGYATSARFNGTVIATKPDFIATCYEGRISYEKVVAHNLSDRSPITEPSDAAEALGVFRNGQLTDVTIKHPERLFTSRIAIFDKEDILVGTRKRIRAKPRFNWHKYLARRPVSSTPGYLLLSAATGVSTGLASQLAGDYLDLPSWTQPIGFVGSIYGGAWLEARLLGGLFAPAAMSGLATSVPFAAYASHQDALRRFSQAALETNWATNYAMKNDGYADNMYFVAHGERRFIPSSLRTTWYCHSEVVQNYCLELEANFKNSLARQALIQDRPRAILNNQGYSPEALRLRTSILEWAR